MDLRRKLELEDYQRIKYLATQGFTIRELSTEFGISTKYVKGIIIGVKPITPVNLEPQITLEQCSGCHRTFDLRGIGDHLSIWANASGTLDCNQVMPTPSI